MDNQDNEKNEDNVNGNDIKISIDNKPKVSKTIIILGILIVLAVVAVAIIVPRVLDSQEEKERILTTSTLEKVIKISDLYTFRAVYNGIAQVMNENEPDQIDYHVSYMSKVNAGFDFNKLDINVNEELKKITVTIPKITISNINVDIASLKYIFENPKANTSTVSEQAYKACIADAENESKKETTIYEIAEENAKNIVEALVDPFIKQLYSEYELEIVMESVK